MAPLRHRHVLPGGAGCTNGSQSVFLVLRLNIYGDSMLYRISMFLSKQICFGAVCQGCAAFRLQLALQLRTSLEKGPNWIYSRTSSISDRAPLQLGLRLALALDAEGLQVCARSRHEPPRQGVQRAFKLFRRACAI